MNEIKARGVEDVLIVVCDALTGLPAAVSPCWPQTIAQACIVHLTPRLAAVGTTRTASGSPISCG